MTLHTDDSSADPGPAADLSPAESWPSRYAARVDERLTRIGVSGDFGRDLLLAVVVALLAAVLFWLLTSFPAATDGLHFSPVHVTVIVLLAAAQSLVLCLRRVRPVTCLVGVGLFQVALIALVPTGVAFRAFAPYIAAYTVGSRLPGRPALLAVTAVTALEGLAGAVVAGALTGLSSGMPSVSVGGSGPVLAPGSFALALSLLLSGAVSYLLAAVAGSYFATRRQNAALVRLRAAEAVRSQRERADAAIGAERARMARELHDIAAHHLSGMVVQAAAVERLIDRDPAAAKQATAWIRAQGKETLDNLRLVVGTLRERGPGVGALAATDDKGELGGDGAPVPGLAVIDRLIGAAGDLGTPVELVRAGEPRDLPPIADVSFYRVAQESLSNAREHAPGAPVRVLLRYLDHAVALEIVNDAAASGRGAGAAAKPPGARRGLGLIGMKERAHLIGAAFEAGPTPSGGWRVSLALTTGGPGSTGHAPSTDGSGAA